MSKLSSGYCLHASRRVGGLPGWADGQQPRVFDTELPPGSHPPPRRMAGSVRTGPRGTPPRRPSRTARPAAPHHRDPPPWVPRPAWGARAHGASPAPSRPRREQDRGRGTSPAPDRVHRCSASRCQSPSSLSGASPLMSGGEVVGVTVPLAMYVTVSFSALWKKSAVLVLGPAVCDTVWSPAVTGKAVV